MAKFSRWLLAPWWPFALATGAKSFRDNPLLGSRRLNAWGLHARRVALAHALATRRRSRLTHLLGEADRERFTRDGFLVLPDLLPPETFARLRQEVLAWQAPAREMLQGDTITRRLALDRRALSQLPTVASFVGSSGWRGPLGYAASFKAAPVSYIQTIFAGAREAPPDPQRFLHADTFHPSAKAWFFLEEVREEDGPFVYVPGSHRATPERLAWERDRSLMAAGSPDRYSARGSPRIAEGELSSLSLPPPRRLAVPANTLVVADTFGFHARGTCRSGRPRLELFGYLRLGPFVPWARSLLPGRGWLQENGGSLLWRTLDLTEALRLRGNPWRPAGRLTPTAPPAHLV